MQSIISECYIWKSRGLQPLVSFRMRQFVCDMREPCPPRLQFAHQFQRLLDRLVHRVRHVAQRVQHQVIETREQWLRSFRKHAEISKVCGGAKSIAQHANIAMPCGNGHNARSNYLKRTVDRMQRHLRNRADRLSAIKNVSER